MVSLTKPRKIPTRKKSPLCSVLRFSGNGVPIYAGKVSPLAANRFAVNPFLCTTLIRHVKKGYYTTDGVN